MPRKATSHPKDARLINPGTKLNPALTTEPFVNTVLLGIEKKAAILKYD